MSSAPSYLVLPNTPSAEVVASLGDTVQAGTGADSVLASIGDNLVLGSTGTLTFYAQNTSSAQAAPNTVQGGAGHLIAYTGSWGGSFQGGTAGDNVLISQTGTGHSSHLVAGGDGDRFFGTENGGSDSVQLGVGFETVVGGNGELTVNSGSGDDAIYAGGASTTVNGAGPAVTTIGGTGNLIVNSTGTGTAVFAGTGFTEVNGTTSGADSIVGGAGGTLTVRGNGANLLVAGNGASTNISTGNGASLVFAGSGNTTLTGGTGSLQVVVGQGGGSITEGSGAATYDVVNGGAGGQYTIANFKPGTDQIDTFGYASYQESVAHSGGNTVLSFSDGTQLTLLGTTTV